MLVSREEVKTDLENNYKAMQAFGIETEDAPLFLPPYEWYNDTISDWTTSMGFQLINFTHGTLSHADYTVPETKGYRSSQEIYGSILDYEANHHSGLNGFILLSHIGTAPQRTDKFYLQLEKLIHSLQAKGYLFLRIDELLNSTP
jgi:peptidoglycan/xylan/chitin deacetylase (PgdA/CDA1 family)